MGLSTPKLRATALYYKYKTAVLALQSLGLFEREYVFEKGHFLASVYRPENELGELPPSHTLNVCHNQVRRLRGVSMYCLHWGFQTCWKFSFRSLSEGEPSSACKRRSRGSEWQGFHTQEGLRIIREARVCSHFQLMTSSGRAHRSPRFL